MHQSNNLHIVPLFFKQPVIRVKKCNLSYYEGNKLFTAYYPLLYFLLLSYFLTRYLNRSTPIPICCITNLRVRIPLRYCS